MKGITIYSDYFYNKSKQNKYQDSLDLFRDIQKVKKKYFAGFLKYKKLFHLDVKHINSIWCFSDSFFYIEFESQQSLINTMCDSEELYFIIFDFSSLKDGIYIHCCHNVDKFNANSIQKLRAKKSKKNAK